MEASEVVDRSLKAISKGKVVYIPGLVNKIAVGLSNLIPRKLYYKLMTGLISGKNNLVEGKQTVREMPYAAGTN
jgi:short-subunit dehydrogenase